MEDRFQQIDEIIENYLQGKLSDSDSRLLVEWLGESRENAQYFRNCCNGWQPQITDSLRESWNSLNLKKHLRSGTLDYRLTENRSWGEKAIHISRVRFIKYAAIILLGIIFAFFLTDRISRHYRNLSEPHWVHAETTAGQKAKIVLPDSSVVWLNSETSLSFPSNFESRKSRTIKLVGEAFFDVCPDKCEFTVQCDDYNIVVKGTRFNVMAYKDFNRTETTLVDGAVTIIRGKQILELLPGERAVFSRNYLTKSKAQIRQATLWKDNRFYFDNIPFKELARRLERWYDVSITLNDPSLNDIYYSGYFKNEETVWQVLDVISMTTPITYVRKEFREIIIDRK